MEGRCVCREAQCISLIWSHGEIVILERKQRKRTREKGLERRGKEDGEQHTAPNKRTLLNPLGKSEVMHAAVFG